MKLPVSDLENDVIVIFRIADDVLIKSAWHFVKRIFIKFMQTNFIVTIHIR